MIKKTTWGLLGAMLLVVPAAPARAEVMLSFDPVNQHTDIGEQIDVGVRISGLGTNAPSSLGVRSNRGVQ